jgi:integrase
MISKKIKDQKVLWGFRYRYKVNGVWVKKESYNKDWSKRQAELQELKFIESLNKPSGETMTFSDLYKMYFSFKKDKMKLRAYRDTMTTCDRHILPYFNDFMLSNIKAHDIEKWQETLLKATYIKSGVKQVYANRQLEKIQINLKAILGFAHDRELIPRNPFNQCGLVKRRELVQEDEKRFITVDEFNRIIQAIELSKIDDLTKAQDLVIFSILFWCGLRKGELMALEVKDYNILTRELKVTKNWDYVNKVMTTPKTNNSVRTVIVPNIVDQYIVRLLSLYKNMIDFTLDKNLVSYHERIAPTTLTRKKDRYCKIAGIKMTLHDFRHSHVSLLVNSGLQPFEIAKRLGHTVEMVNEVYGHLYPSKQKEMVAIMNQAS